MSVRNGRSASLIAWLRCLAATSVVCMAALPARAQTMAPTYTADGEVPPTVEVLRRNMLAATGNALTFQSMDRLFETRVVTRAGPVWRLDRADVELPSYTFDGAQRSVSQFEERTFTNALLVMRDGRIVYENYRNNSGPDTHFISFSMAKSVTSMAVGLAVDRGLIASVDDPVTRYVPELTGTAFGKASIRDVLEMRSGADFTERYDFGKNPSVAAQIFEQTLVSNRRRFADFAFDVGVKHDPGAAFNYSTLDTAVIGWVIERATGQRLAHFMAEHLWEPAGMESYGYWLADGKPGVGREMNGMAFNATLRDYGRLGQMMLNKGRANGQQILSPQWVETSTSMKPTSAEEAARGRPAYGFFWWRVDDSAAFVAIGLQGQYIYVDPVSRTVIVKLSYFPPAADDALAAESVAFFQSVSRWAGSQMHGE